MHSGPSVATASTGCLLALTLAVGAISALPYAGGWNDGSRLAAIEAIADHGTLAIDDSIFVRVPVAPAHGIPPYPADRTDLLSSGTKDKLYISGGFYSDKPYLVSILLAGVYRSLQYVGLPRAEQRPDLFCWSMTVLTSGVAYAVAVACMHRVGWLLALPGRLNVLWTLSFAFATFAPAYTRHVNGHMMLLAVTSAVVLQMVHTHEAEGSVRPPWRRIAGLGALGGAAFCLDPGSGPLLVFVLVAYVAWRYRRCGPVIVLAASASPLVIGQLWLNVRIGGVLLPTNMVPAYSEWPGSAFNAQNLTGFCRHSPFEFLVYAAALLFGKHGFAGHNLPLLLLIQALPNLIRRPFAGRIEALLTLGWCGATWLLYAALSDNHGGACCSVRWFVPFLAPAYFALAIDLRMRNRQSGFQALSGWGALMAAIMWWKGPWASRMVPGYWLIVAAALLTWLAIHVRRRQAQRSYIGSLPAARPRAA